LKQIGYYFRSQHDFEREVKFIKDLMVDHKVYIFHDSNFKKSKYSQLHCYWVEINPNHLIDYVKNLDILLIDSSSIIIQHRFYFKISKFFNSAYNHTPKSLRKTFLYITKALVLLLFRSIKSNVNKLIFNPRGIDYKIDFPSFVDICLFDGFLAFGPTDLKLLKSRLVENIYLRPYYYGNFNLSNKKQIKVCQPSKFVLMPTYFHDSDPSYEIKKALNFMECMKKKSFKLIYRPHPNFIKNWSNKQLIKLTSSGIHIHRDNVETIYSKKHAFVCDLSSTFFTCVSFDIIVFIPQLDGSPKKQINNQLMHAIKPYLPFFVIQARCSSESAELIIDKLNDVYFLRRQSEARKSLRKILFSQSELNLSSFLNHIS